MNKEISSKPSLLVNGSIGDTYRNMGDARLYNWEVPPPTWLTHKQIHTGEYHPMSHLLYPSASYYPPRPCAAEAGGGD